MGVQLHIPDSITHAIRLPEDRLANNLRVELAVALYSQGLLSFGKSCELAEMETYAFGRLLGARNAPRHYGQDDLEDDLVYAYGERLAKASSPATTSHWKP